LGSDEALVSLPQAQCPAATKADSDQKLLASWLDSLGSPHTRRAYNATGRAFSRCLLVPCDPPRLRMCAMPLILST